MPARSTKSTKYRPPARRKLDDGDIPPQPSEPLRDDMLLTYAEAAAYFRASPRMVERWVNEGKLPASRLPGGRGRRVRGVDIRLAIEDNLITTGSDSDLDPPRAKRRRRAA
jgi:excisionase family DNA binding protein